MGLWQGPLENLVMNPSFWKDKRVLVTGHTGFKGGWLCLWLQQLGASVSGYSLSVPTNPSLFEAAHVGERMRSYIGDVRDFSSLRVVIEKERPEIVFHMAAQSLVRYSYSHPVETYGTNVMGTVCVLEAVRQVGGVRAVVNVTSDKCYENREWPWGYREIEPMGGYDPYSNSKACAEFVTSAYRSSFFNNTTHDRHGVAVASARAGNVIGGGDWSEDRLVPDIIRAIVANRPVVIRNPDAVRPWQHVLEPLSGYLLLAEGLCVDGASFSEGWNFGPADEDARSVQWIVERLTRWWGNGATWIHDEGSNPHEAGYLKLDTSKARSRLGWFPRWGIDTALGSTVEWYRGYLEKKDMQEMVLQQIAAYNQQISSTG